MSERERLRGALRLYAITPGEWPGDAEMANAIAAAIRGGASVIQLRAKDVQEAALRTRAALVRDVCAEHGVPWILNDNPKLAVELGAAGAHLGPDDGSLSDARDILGPERWLGASAGTIAAARAAMRDGADYLGVGAIYDASPSKTNASAPRGPEIISEFRGDPVLEHVPIVAIGGIRADNAGRCIRAGADGVAVIRAVLGASDPEAASRAILRSITEVRRR